MNMTRRAAGNSSCYTDDCGAWPSAPSSITYCTSTGTGTSLKVIIKKGDTFCLCETINKKTILTPITSQPEPQNIVEVHRIYNKLKALKLKHTNALSPGSSHVLLLAI